MLVPFNVDGVPSSIHRKGRTKGGRAASGRGEGIVNAQGCRNNSKGRREEAGAYEKEGCVTHDTLKRLCSNASIQCEPSDSYFPHSHSSPVRFKGGEKESRRDQGRMKARHKHNDQGSLSLFPSTWMVSFHLDGGCNQRRERGNRQGQT